MADAAPQRSIFVTGAASGIGRATARLFAGRGWFVGAFDVDERGLAARAGAGAWASGRAARQRSRSSASSTPRA